jgi:hypothetical protein
MAEKIEHDSENVNENENINDKISGLSNKFTQEDWISIERKFNNFEMKVLDCLKLLAISDSYEIQQEYNVLGEEHYISNRMLLEKANLVPPKKDNNDDKEKTINIEDKKKCGKDKKGKNTQLSKKDLIILEQSKKRAREEIEDVLKKFGGEFQPIHAFNNEYVEIKGIGLLYAGSYLFNNNLNFRKKKHLSFVFTVMVSIERFINVCQNLEGKNISGSKEKVSNSLLEDLKYWLTKLQTIYTYNGLVIQDYAPELLVFTDYDIAIPRVGIKPRKHQIELMLTIKMYFYLGFLLCYNPPMGSGKTTFIVAIAYYVDWVRKNIPGKEKFQLIFACNLVPVRDHAASLCYNAGIKFGIGYQSYQTKKCKIQNHFICPKDDERLVIITSPEMAYDILSDDFDCRNSENYMLFLDEPTVGADLYGSETLKTNMAVLSVAPKRTILSSATFPELEKVPDILDYFKLKYPNIITKTVYSNEIQIGCDIKTFDFGLVVPHLGIKTKLQLSETLDTIQKNPFLGRTYTSDVVRSLWKTMKENKIDDVPNIMEIFQNVDNMTSDKVREIAMKMLELLLQYDDKIIKKVCSSEIMKDDIVLSNIDMEEKKKKEKNEQKKEKSIWDEEDEEDELNNNQIDFTKLATTQSWIMQNTTLIATPEPLDFVKTYFYGFVQDIYNHKEDYINPITKKPEESIYKNTKSILRIYEKEMADLNKQKTEYEKSLEKGSNKKTKQTGDNGKIKDEKRITKDDIDRKIQDYDNNMPKIKFPDFGHINSEAHIKKYCKKEVSKLMGKNMRNPPPIESILYTKFDIPDELLTLLYAGVGVYSTINKNLCPNYLKTVLEMASNGQLAYIISDVSICYGTNYPINRIIVTDEFAEKHSINTLFQLFGRAGRVGRSWIAVIYVSQKTGKKLINYAQEKSKIVVVEADNMIKTFNEHNNKTSLLKNDILDNILSKYISSENLEEQQKINTNQTQTKSSIIFYKNSKGNIVEKVQNMNLNSNLNQEKSNDTPETTNLSSVIKSTKHDESAKESNNWRRNTPIFVKNEDEKQVKPKNEVKEVKEEKKNFKDALDFSILRNIEKKEKKEDIIKEDQTKEKQQSCKSQDNSKEMSWRKEDNTNNSKVDFKPESKPYIPAYKKFSENKNEVTKNFNFMGKNHNNNNNNNHKKYNSQNNDMSWRRND